MNSFPKNSRVILYGGLGNQLFQLAAGIFATQGKPLELESSLGDPRLGSQGGAALEDFVLPANVIPLRRIKRSQISRRIFHYALMVSSFGRRGRLSRFVVACAESTMNFASVFTRNKDKFSLSDGTGFDPLLSPLTEPRVLIGCFQSYRWAFDVQVMSSLSSIKPRQVPKWLEELAEYAELEMPIVVHIRRGDYAKVSELGFLTSDYYLRAIEILRLRHKNSTVWVFSDDFDYCREILPQAILATSRFVDYEQENAVGNLSAMRLGHAYVLSNSTFSWWGAFLSKSISPTVIYPSKWFLTHDAPLDLIPNDWEELKVTS